MMDIAVLCFIARLKPTKATTHTELRLHESPLMVVGVQSLFAAEAAASVELSYFKSLKHLLCMCIYILTDC